MDERKLRERLFKLHKLALEGVGGEREAAEHLLRKLLDKHGLSLEDIAGEAVDLCWFEYQTQIDTALFEYIVRMCVVSGDTGLYMSDEHQNQVGCYATASERVEIDLRYQAYRKELHKEVELLLTAFIHKHKIFPPDQVFVDPEPTEEHWQQVMTVRRMMSRMKDIPIHKALPTQTKQLGS